MTNSSLRYEGRIERLLNAPFIHLSYHLALPGEEMEGLLWGDYDFST